MSKNILLYFTDQQRADTVGCYGQPLSITPALDRLAKEGVRFDNAFTAQPVCGPCRALFQTGRYPTEIGCYRNNQMLPHDVKTLANYIEEAGYETAYIGKWHLASDGELEATPTIDHTITAIPREYRGGYTGFWRTSDVLEFTSHGYDGYVFDENNNRIDFEGYRADCMADFALEYLDKKESDKPFFMTISQIEPHHQNDRKCYEGPKGSKEKYKDFVLPADLAALSGGDALVEYPDYLGACASLDENLGRIVDKLKEKGIYEDTVIIFVSDHGSHFKTRNRDEHLNGYDDYKRSGHDAALRVPFVITGGEYTGGQVVKDLVSTASLPKTILSIAGVDVGDQMIGEDLLTVVKNTDENRVNEVYAQISESRVGRVLRTERYLYGVYAPGINGGECGDSDVYADDYLYDMANDPHQLNNVVQEASYKETKEMLRTRLLSWILETEKKVPTLTD